MATYRATMMDAETGSDSPYPFEGPDDLMARTPARIVNFFMELVDRKLLPDEHIDYELNFATKSGDDGVVTAAGSLLLEKGGSIPFLLMIARG